MPIKPENLARYPKNWKLISASIRQRAGNRCEWSGCTAYHHTVGYWHDGQFVAMPRTLREAGFKVGDTVVATDKDGRHISLKLIRIVLTVAHLGLPAHLPVHLHVAASAEANEVVEMVGFLMPLQPEVPEWTLMMHRHALANFFGRSAATPAHFAVTLPRSFTSSLPGGPVAHGAAAVAPQIVVLTGWRLCGKPAEAARIAAKAAAGTQVPPADLERLTAAFADAFAQPAFRAAHCFIATGRRTGLDAIGGLLRGQRKGGVADDALRAAGALSFGAANAGPFQTSADAAVEFEAALRRTGFLWPVGDMRKVEPAYTARHECRAESRSGHASILMHFDEYPEHCDPSNLRAWCQKHHLQYDLPHHKQTAYATRRAGNAVADLFEDA